MGEGKRKTAMADEATENPQKSRRLDTDAAEALLDLSHSPSKGEEEATTGDSTYDIGSCEHLFKDSEDLDEIARDLKNAHKLPKCEHYPCSTTWRGAAGMMVCTECSLTFCTGEKGDREHPQGHAAWHAANDQHWVALWCDEPSKGYCFECRHTLMLGQNKVIEDNYALVPRNKKDEWGMVASNPNVDSAMLPRNVNVDWGMLGSNVMHPTGMVASNAMDPWGMMGSNAMDHWGTMGSNAMDQCGMVAGDDHVVRGIPNLGDTCYMNASLQCLLALGKLRTMFLRPDARLGDIGLHLKQLFLATSCGNNATQMPDPEMMPTYMWSLYPNRFQRKVMGDSHEFLASLCDALHNEVEQLNNLQGEALFPTFSNSIFSCELLDMVSCKVCSHDEVTHYSLHGIQLAAPSKDPLARSKPLQVDSTEGKDIVHGLLQTQKNDIPRGIVDVSIKALDFIPKLFDDFGGMEELVADSHNPEEKEKAQSSETVHDVAEHMNSLPSIEDCLKLFSHGLTDCTNCSKVAAELPETDGSKNVEPIMASTNVNTTVDGDQTDMSDMKTCPSERSSDFGSLSAESPSRQPYLSDSHHQVTLSEDITSEEVTSGKSCGDKDLTSCSTTHGKAESHEGVQEAALSCLTTDEQTDLLSAQNIQDTSTQKHSSGKQVMYDHSAQQVAEKQNKQTAIQTRLISKLPPVLTIQLQRHSPGLPKLSGHVSFKEILHLGPFMDPSSEDKDNLSYRLVGVIEHIGVGVNVGHYIAYVRASRGQQGSGPSSWVCANDSMVRRVSLEEVLRCEAYILFYERIDNGGIVDDGQ